MKNILYFIKYVINCDKIYYCLNNTYLVTLNMKSNTSNIEEKRVNKSSAELDLDTELEINGKNTTNLKDSSTDKNDIREPSVNQTDDYSKSLINSKVEHKDIYQLEKCTDGQRFEKQDSYVSNSTISNNISSKSKVIPRNCYGFVEQDGSSRSINISYRKPLKLDSGNIATKGENRFGDQDSSVLSSTVSNISSTSNTENKNRNNDSPHISVVYNDGSKERDPIKETENSKTKIVKTEDDIQEPKDNVRNSQAPASMIKIKTASRIDVTQSDVDIGEKTANKSERVNKSSLNKPSLTQSQVNNSKTKDSSALAKSSLDNKSTVTSKNNSKDSIKPKGSTNDTENKSASGIKKASVVITEAPTTIESKIQNISKLIDQAQENSSQILVQHSENLSSNNFIDQNLNMSKQSFAPDTTSSPNNQSNSKIDSKSFDNDANFNQKVITNSLKQDLRLKTNNSVQDSNSMESLTEVTEVLQNESRITDTKKFDSNTLADQRSQTDVKPKSIHASHCFVTRSTKISDSVTKPHEFKDSVAQQVDHKVGNNSSLQSQINKVSESRLSLAAAYDQNSKEYLGQNHTPLNEEMRFGQNHIHKTIIGKKTSVDSIFTQFQEFNNSAVIKKEDLNKSVLLRIRSITSKTEEESRKTGDFGGIAGRAPNLLMKSQQINAEENLSFGCKDEQINFSKNYSFPNNQITTKHTKSLALEEQEQNYAQNNLLNSLINSEIYSQNDQKESIGCFNNISELGKSGVRDSKIEKIQNPTMGGNTKNYSLRSNDNSLSNKVISQNPIASLQFVSQINDSKQNDERFDNKRVTEFSSKFKNKQNTSLKNSVISRLVESQINSEDENNQKQRKDIKKSVLIEQESNFLVNYNKKEEGFAILSKSVKHASASLTVQDLRTFTIVYTTENKTKVNERAGTLIPNKRVIKNVDTKYFNNKKINVKNLDKNIAELKAQKTQDHIESKDTLKFKTNYNNYKNLSSNQLNKAQKLISTNKFNDNLLKNKINNIISSSNYSESKQELKDYGMNSKKLVTFRANPKLNEKSKEVKEQKRQTFDHKPMNEFQLNLNDIDETNKLIRSKQNQNSKKIQELKDENLKLKETCALIAKFKEKEALFEREKAIFEREKVIYEGEMKEILYEEYLDQKLIGESSDGTE